MRPLPVFALVAALSAAGVVLVPQTPAAPRPPLFSDSTRQALVAYWNAPGRYTSEMWAEGARKGPWVVRLTPEGSEWLLRYQRAITGGRKIPPGEVARAPASGATADWEPWVSARIACDRSQALRSADSANARLLARPADPAPPPAPPSAPGPIPATLLSTCGNPPCFSEAVVPRQFTVTLDNEAETYTYTDNVKLPDRYAYYRFRQGVVAYGAALKALSDADRGKLFRDAGFTPAEQRIFSAVSGLEGGFETVQTYDTGFLSVGFIQFVTLAEGKHDLSRVLAQERQDDPGAYRDDFQRFGIDVQGDDLALTVVDPATGAELLGPEAVKKVVDDKRLVAVFQNAGRHSRAFRVAQIKVARSFYWPTDDPLAVSLPDGTKVEGKIGDLIKSEAGLATILDRKINTGNVRPLADVVARVMQAHQCRSLAEAVRYEREIVAAMKYRTDFLRDRSLGQPGAADSAAPATEARPPAVETSAAADGQSAGKPRGFWSRLGRIFR